MSLSNKTILIIEDEQTQMARYLKLAKEAGLDARGVFSETEARDLLAQRSFHFVLTDIHLSPSTSSFDGIRILRHIREHLPEVVPLAMSADINIDTYHQAIKEGALHFFRKPIINAEELLTYLEAALSRKFASQAAGARSSLPSLSDDLKSLCPDGIVLPNRIRDTAHKVAMNRRVPVVIYGETGTGKEEVAKLIHRRRVEMEGHTPFVSVNCANLYGDMALSLLFGHVKGAFTGANQTTNGYIGEAAGGILFLDEIHTLSAQCQQRLLRVLNDGVYERLGDTKLIHSEFQVICASTKDLDEEVDKGTFLLDLRMRLTGIDIPLTPLRERKDEIPLLIRLFFAKEGVSVPEAELTRIARRCQEFYWRGNIRQLFKALHALLVMSSLDEHEIKAENLPVYKTMLDPHNTTVPNDTWRATPSMGASTASVGTDTESQAILSLLNADQALETSMDAFEKQVMINTMRRYPKIKDAVEVLQLARSTFDAKRKKHSI